MDSLPGCVLARLKFLDNIAFQSISVYLGMSPFSLDDVARARRVRSRLELVYVLCSMSRVLSVSSFYFFGDCQRASSATTGVSIKADRFRTSFWAGFTTASQAHRSPSRCRGDSSRGNVLTSAKVIFVSMFDARHQTRAPSLDTFAIGKCNIICRTTVCCIAGSVSAWGITGGQTSVSSAIQDSRLYF